MSQGPGDLDSKEGCAMSESPLDTTTALLTGPFGGGGIGFGLWYLFKEPCPIGPIQSECAHFAGQTMYSPAGFAITGTILGFVLAGLAVLIFGTDDSRPLGGET
jgi:hypothetical protein